jgi:hypothetical protein
MASKIPVLPFNVPNDIKDTTFAITVSKNFKAIEHIFAGLGTDENYGILVAKVASLESDVSYLNDAIAILDPALSGLISDVSVLDARVKAARINLKRKLRMGVRV